MYEGPTRKPVPSALSLHSISTLPKSLDLELTPPPPTPLQATKEAAEEEAKYVAEDQLKMQPKRKPHRQPNRHPKRQLKW